MEGRNGYNLDMDEAWLEREHERALATPPTEVLPGLWQSSIHVDKEWVRQHIDLIIDISSPDEQLIVPGVRRWYTPIVDGEVEGEGAILELCREGAATLVGGKRVLVVCGWGRNRSGMVAAVMAAYATGAPGEEAVALVQGTRPRALNNDGFVELVRRVPEGTAPPFEGRS